MPGQVLRQDVSSAVAVSQPVARVPGSASPARARRQTRRALHPLDQALFQDALARERRQADRFEKSFGLVLVIPAGVGGGAAAWEPLLRGVAASARDTDIVGWFENGTVLGVIRWALDAAETAATLRATTERDIEHRLGASDAAGYRVRSHVYSPQAESLGAPLLEALVGRRPAAVARPSPKRALDIAGSAVLLLASSPALLVIAALVKATSKGPVFFRQQRVGEHGKPFNMLKFRTMQAAAGHDLHQQYVSQYIRGQVRSDGAAAPVFKIIGDPRVTKVGHFLRRTSLDELPQFWNVLKGEMSLVGPRPPLPYEVKIYKHWHWRRVFEAKPGITGLWQVTGRSRTTFDEMVRLDIRYARQQSVWTDVKILLATPRAVISGSGAH
jgi:lipopolysaccharide/colanic/teichoic acid biosynthesis glycosyltransferase